MLSIQSKDVIEPGNNSFDEREGRLDEKEESRQLSVVSCQSSVFSRES